MLLTECSLIALNFDLRGFDRSAHTTPLLELLAQRLQSVGRFRGPVYDGDCFAAAPLCLPANPDNAVTD